jgi:hypothetical protein
MVAVSTIQALREQLERFNRPRVEAGAVRPTGWPAVDAVLGGGLRAGSLHEWFGVSVEGEPVRRGRRWSPPLSVLVHLARAGLAAPGPPRWAVWIGRMCFPYAPVLAAGPSETGAFKTGAPATDASATSMPETDAHRAADTEYASLKSGLTNTHFPNAELSRDGSPRDGARSGGLLARSLWVTPPNADGRLWAVDLALRSPAVGVVLADGSGFSMAATRRVQLLAAEHGVGALLVRPPWERGELSAAQTRWQVCWHPARAVGADGIPRPRWRLKLLRCKGVQIVKTQSAWILEWDGDTGALHLPAELADPARPARARATTGEARPVAGTIARSA